MPAGLLNGAVVPITGNNLIDAMTNGYRWQLDSSRTVDWSISNGWFSEYWSNPSDIAIRVGAVLSLYSYYADINFNYLGCYSSPLTANSAGSDINVALDGNNVFFNSSSSWALGYFPNPSEANRGDIYINSNSLANFISYEPGSAGWFLLAHEIGHTLGLKHPHDDGGTGRPTFAQLGWINIDIDYMTVMSYNDTYNFNLTAYDPATPMILDVLALQYLYGKNMSTNAGNSNFTLTNSNMYLTIWDASGTDVINQSGATEGWYIVLPNVQLTTLVDTKAGVGIPLSDINLITPRSLAWLAGDIENVIGSSFADQIYGNSLANNIDGGAGNDFIQGGAGNDTIICGDGIDTCAFDLSFSNYVITYALGAHTITALSGSEGADTITGVENLSFANQVISVSSLDLTAPTVTTFSPLDAAIGVAIGSNMVVTFSENIQRGTGNIVLKDAANNAIATYDAATSTNLSISGSTLTINPSSDLSYSTQYYVTFASGTIKDLAGNSYAGTSNYDFTTASAPDIIAPTVETFSPSDAAIGVVVGSNIVLTFNESIQKGTGTIYLRSGSATGTIVEQFDAATSARITASGYTLTIDPTNNLANSTQYFVTFASGTVKDLAGNNYAGTTTYDFTTVALTDTTPPTIAISSNTTTLTAGGTATITFTLSEASTSFTASDVTVSGGVLSNFSGSGTSYTALFTPTANSTTNGVVTVASGVFTDAAGNANADGSDANNTVTMTVNTVSADTTPPTIAISSNTTTLTAGGTATITFTLSEASTSFTASDVTVSGGVLSNFSGSGTSYTALFTPTANSTTNGVVTVANGVFTDAAGNTNADGSDANNTVTMTVNTVPAQTHIVTDSSLSATYSQAASHYVMSFDSLTGDVLITDPSQNNNEIRQFTELKRLEFDDLSLNLEVRDVANSIPSSALNRITELYVSFFNRVPDGDGMQYWIGQYQGGKTINNIAESFYAAGVFYSEITGYRPDMTREEFIRVVYKNVLGRDEVDQGGMTYWDAALADGRETKASLVNTILGVAHSAEFSNPANSYHWVQQLLDNKLDLAKMVSVEWGVNYNTPQDSISKGMAIAAAVTPDQIDVAIGLVGINVVESL